MRVLILREGKESSQGVAYLDDGTMVVVDGARRLINRTVDILVTSVHQTPAGKMIFGRLEERHDASAAKSTWTAASSSEVLPADNGNGNGHARPEARQRTEAGSRTGFPDTERP